MFRSNSWLAALLGIALAGCGGSTAEPPASRESGPAPAEQPASVPAPRLPPPAGLTSATRIFGVVFEDKNRNGQLDETDVRMPTQTVLVTNPSATQRIREVTTAADGSFRFDNLPDGEYRLSLQIPSGYNRTTDDSFSLKVGAGREAFGAQFGVIPR